MTVPAATLPNLESFERGKQMATYDELGSTVADRGASMVAVRDVGNKFAGITGGIEGVLQNGVAAKGDVLTCTVTFEAEAANVRDVTVQVQDAKGTNVAGAKKVRIETVAVTANKGDIAAPVVLPAAGTLDVTSNPATGANIAYATTDANGKLTLSVADDAVETVGLTATVAGGLPKVVETTFA